MSVKVAAGRGTNLAKCGTKGIRSTTLARVSVALALAFGLASGTSAKAAPPPGAPIENPFDKGGDSVGSSESATRKATARGAAGDDKGSAAPSDEAARGPAIDSGANHDETAESGDLGEGRERQRQ